MEKIVDLFLAREDFDFNVASVGVYPVLLAPIRFNALAGTESGEPVCY